MAGLWIDEVVGEGLGPGDVCELDVTPLRMVERGNGGRQQTGTLAGEYSLQQQAGLVEGGGRKARRSRRSPVPVMSKAALVDNVGNLEPNRVQ